jgi:serine phosphatase RsbU (regulator of sigma subunit)
LQHARVELATALQKTMLPTLPEHLAGLGVAARYRPSRDGLDIGRDWYDAFVMPDGTVAMEIGVRTDGELRGFEQASPARVCG